jgi:parallel beta-helix repeat protein
MPQLPPAPLRSTLLALLLGPVGLVGCAPSLVGEDSDVKATGTLDGLEGEDDDGSTGDGSEGGDGSDGSDGGDGGDGSDGGDVPVDEDGDGHTTETDCDDTDPEVSPDADESHNGIDDDCDGYVDEIELCEDGIDDLQDAIDDAPDGATLLLCAGTWPGSFVVDRKELTIVGLEGAELTELTADGGGRVLAVTDNAELSLQGLTLRDGTADTGGVLVCADAELHTDSVILSEGVATETGGVMAAYECDLDLNNTIIRQGVAESYGGGLFTNASRGTLTGVSIADNLGLEGGGAFIYDGQVDIVASEIVDNETTSVDETVWGPGAGGGGLWTSNSDVSETLIARNHSAYQGGGAYFYRGNPSFVGNTIEDNTCNEDGAGIYFNVSRATVEGNLFQRNIAADDAGGLRFYYGNSRVEGNVFIENQANDDGGGAKFSHSEHVFINNVMERNVTGDAGGGLELDNDSTHVADSVFRDNRAYRGAGVHNWRTETEFTIEDSEFTGNIATDCGGGISFDNSPHLITLERLWFEDNEADDGGGVCTDRVYRDPEDVGGQENYFQDTLLEISNSAFKDNDVSDDGGAIYVRAGIVDVLNVVMDGNSGPGVGTMVVKGSTATLTNAIVVDSSGGNVLRVEDSEDGAGSFAVSYSAFDDNDGGFGGMDSPIGSDGNISADPDFSSAGDYTLDSSSPCINAGDPSIDDRDGSRSDMGMHGGPSAP